MSRFDDTLRYDAQNSLRLSRLIETRKIPACCPFCESQELKIRFFEEHYYDAGKRELIEFVLDDGLHIFCVKCEEEIREEDVHD